MTDLTEPPAGDDEPDENELGYQNLEEERAYDKAGEEGPPGDDPAAEGENRS